MKYKVTHLSTPVRIDHVNDDNEFDKLIAEYINKPEFEGWKLLSFVQLGPVLFRFIWEKA